MAIETPLVRYRPLQLKVETGLSWLGVIDHIGILKLVPKNKRPLSGVIPQVAFGFRVDHSLFQSGGEGSSCVFKSYRYRVVKRSLSQAGR